MILTNQLHFLTTYIRDTLNENASRTKSIIDEFQLEQLKNYQCGKNLTQRRMRGPTTWKDMLKNTLRCWKLANKKTEQFVQSLKVLAWMITIFKKEELEPAGELAKVCSQIVMECLCLARMCRPEILWSANKFAQSVTKWTGACDRPSDYRRSCHVGNTAQHCRLGLFQDSDLLATLRTQNQPRGESNVSSEVEHSSP